MNDGIHADLSFAVIGAAMEVHKELGIGYPEKVYHAAFERELSLRGIPFISQQSIPVMYKGAVIAEYFLDLVVDNKIVVELKALSSLVPEHRSQVITYLKASKLPLGLLFNFGEQSLTYKRIILNQSKKNL